MTKCKNCGHELLKNIFGVVHSDLRRKTCGCGCTNPEPEEVGK